MKKTSVIFLMLITAGILCDYGNTFPGETAPAVPIGSTYAMQDAFTAIGIAEENG